jgi:DMSO/TMAO reductase YedYZ molybdopterin-dependent catalytic subunit
MFLLGGKLPHPSATATRIKKPAGLRPAVFDLRSSEGIKYHRRDADGMVFSLFHLIPSAIAAILAAYITFARPRGGHKRVAFVMLAFAAVGLAGFAYSGDWIQLVQPSAHSLHAWMGFAALVFSFTPFLFRERAGRKRSKFHHLLGMTAGVLALASLALGVALLLGVSPGIIQSGNVSYHSQQFSASSALPEKEASEFLGVSLMPISEQGNNAIEGTQRIDRGSYRLEVGGLVSRNLSLSYADLLAFPAYAEVVYMPCVEGWGFDAKWTGLRVSDILSRAGPLDSGTYVVFYAADGYSAGLPLSYLEDEQILLAYGINDLTLPPERGFPLQLVAKSKYGYKWAKWITRIEVVGEEMRGYWESRGYNNKADAGGPAFG